MAKKTFTIQLKNSLADKTKTINISNPYSDISKTQTAAFKSAYIELYRNSNTTSSTTIAQSYYNVPTYVDEPAV